MIAPSSGAASSSAAGPSTAGQAGSGGVGAPSAGSQAGVAEGIALKVDDGRVGAVDFAKGDGLVPAIVQDATDGTVLTLAYMDPEALRRTLETGRSWFYSRSRQEYWLKGETSGDRQYVRALSYDCDGDALLVEVDQEGAGACHTGERTCFYRAFGDS